MNEYEYIYSVNEIIQTLYDENVKVFNIQMVWEICKNKFKCIHVIKVNTKQIYRISCIGANGTTC
jgi:hypothetical protein